MCVTDSCEGGIVVHEILILCLVCPVDGVDRIRLVVAVLDTLLVTVEFLTIEDEWNTLRCVNRCLCELYHPETLCFGSFRSLFETVTEAVVIVAADIAHVLERVACPCLYSHLRMLDSTCDTELHVCLVACDSVHESCILAAERATYRVTDVVAECTDLVEHVCICLEGDLLCRVCRCLRSPSLAIDHDIRIDCVEALADLVHGVDVMDGHEVETESVDMILLHPPLERLDHVLAEHFLL